MRAGLKLLLISPLVMLVAGCDLAITQSADPDPAFVGQELTYTLNVTNNPSNPPPESGDQSVPEVTVEDTLPKNVDFVSATPSKGSCGSPDSEGVVTCNIGALEVNETATIEIVVIPTVAGQIENTASVAAGEEGPTTAEEDPPVEGDPLLEGPFCNSADTPPCDPKGNNTTTITTEVNQAGGVSSILSTWVIWVPTALVALAGFGMAHFLVWIDLGRPKVVGKLLNSVAREGGGMGVAVDGEKARRYERLRTVAVVVVALLTGAALTVWAWFSFIQQYGTFWKILIPLVGGVVAVALVALIARSLKVRVEQSINKRMGEVSGMFADLDEDLERLSALATELKIDFPVSDHLQQSEEYLDNHAAQVVADPASSDAGLLGTVLERAREGVRDDISHLESALEQLEAAETAHASASRAVAHSPSLVAAADQLHSEIHRARTLLLPAREWQTFQEAMEVSKTANEMFVGLDEDLEKLSSLASEELEIDFPVSDNLQELNNHGADLAANPGLLEAVLERAREGVRDDISHLEKALEQLEAAEAAHVRASRAVAHSPSLVAAADQLHSEIHRARTLLLPAREWQTFQEAMEDYSEELQGLEAGVGSGGESSRGTSGGYDPYQVLGADPSMSTKEIKRLYRRLSRVHHPDAGNEKDGEKFTKIKEAWDAICKERGEEA